MAMKLGIWLALWQRSRGIGEVCATSNLEDNNSDGKSRFHLGAGVARVMVLDR